MLTDLENDSFTVRDKAEKELANRGATIEPALRKALEGKPDLEKRQRIEAVLEKITTTSGEHLRALRALEALENINTPEARRLLKALSHGVSQAWLTEEAATVYKRAEQSSHTAPE